MTDALNGYLLQHNSINIPGLGSIYIQKIPVTTDFVNKQLYPVSFSYRFDKRNDTPDKLFYNYLAARKGMSESEAIEWYNQFSTTLRTAVKNDGYFEWNGVGVFKQDGNGDILFEEQRTPLPLRPVPARRVIRKDAQHAILVGDQEKTNVQMTEMLSTETVQQEEVVEVKKERWWISALILFIAALIIIFFHYYNNGFKWSATGNQQKIEVQRP